MKKFVLIFVLIHLMGAGVFAQVAVNKDGSNPDPDAILHVKGSGNNHFYIDDANGYVGIGTLSPGLPLVVEKDWGNSLGQHPLANFQNHGNAGNAGLRFYYWGDGTNTTGAGIRSTTGKELYMGTFSNARALTILDDGSVGIGTTTPTVDFEVADAGSNAYENSIIKTSLYSDGLNAMPRFMFVRSHSPVLHDDTSANAVTQDGDVLGRLSFGGVRVNGSGGSSTSAGWLEMIQKGSSTSEVSIPGQFQVITSDGLGDRDVRLVVNPEGNVGIGTEYPYAKLVVADNEDAWLRISGDHDNSGGDNGTQNAYLQLTTDGGDNNHDALIWLENLAGDARLHIDVENEDVMVFHNGRVGIGNNSPSRDLDIGGSLFFSSNLDGTPEGQIDFNSYSGTSDRMIIRKNTGQSTFGEINVVSNHDLRIRTADADRMVIKNNGDIGIGTLTPTEKLDLEGNLEMNGNQILNMRLENRTSDPASPAVGQIWIRTDL